MTSTWGRIDAMGENKDGDRKKKHHLDACDYFFTGKGLPVAGPCWSPFHVNLGLDSRIHGVLRSRRLAGSGRLGQPVERNRRGEVQSAMMPSFWYRMQLGV